jgi:hypothetical protein
MVGFWILVRFCSYISFSQSLYGLDTPRLYLFLFCTVLRILWQGQRDLVLISRVEFIRRHDQWQDHVSLFLISHLHRAVSVALTFLHKYFPVSGRALKKSPIMDMSGMGSMGDSGGFIVTNSALARSFWYLIAGVLSFSFLLRIADFLEARIRSVRNFQVYHVLSDANMRRCDQITNSSYPVYPISIKTWELHQAVICHCYCHMSRNLGSGTSFQ